MSGRTGPQGPRGPQAPHLAGDERAAAAKAAAGFYGRGRSIRDIAEYTGRTYGVVRTLLLEAGVKLRGRGARPRKENP